MYAPMKQSFAQTCVLCFHRLAGSPSDAEGGANMDEEVVVDVYDNPHANDSGPEMENFDVEEAPEELLRQDGDLPAEEEDVEQPLPAPVVAAPGRGRAEGDTVDSDLSNYSKEVARKHGLSLVCPTLPFSLALSPNRTCSRSVSNVTRCRAPEFHCRQCSKVSSSCSAAFKGALRDIRAGSNQELLAKLNSGNNV